MRDFMIIKNLHLDCNDRVHIREQSIVECQYISPIYIHIHIYNVNIHSIFIRFYCEFRSIYIYFFNFVCFSYNCMCVCNTYTVCKR